MAAGYTLIWVREGEWERKECGGVLLGDWEGVANMVLVGREADQVAEAIADHGGIVIRDLVTVAWRRWIKEKKSPSPPN